MRIAQIAPLIESVPAEALRRDGTYRLLPDRGAGAAGPRGDVCSRAAIPRRRPNSWPASPRRFAWRRSTTRCPIACCSSRSSAAALATSTSRTSTPISFTSRSRAVSAAPAVTTLHGRLDLPFYRPLFSEFAEMPVVSISDDQRRRLPARWIATVLHGLPPDLYSLSGRRPADIWRSSAGSARKSVPTARSRSRGAPASSSRSRPRSTRSTKAISRTRSARSSTIQGSNISARSTTAEKQAFLGGALALLFPIDWPEPFGLVQIEAMACGTPVIAWRRGSVPR